MPLSHRSPRASRRAGPRRWAPLNVPGATILTLLALVTCACSTGDGGTGGGGDNSGPTIKVTITAPAKDAFLSDLITVTGTIEGGANHKTKLVIKGKDTCKIAADSPLKKASTSTDLDELEKYAKRYFVPYKDVKTEADAIRKALADRVKLITDKCEASGTSFSIPFSSQQHDAKDKPLFKDGKLTISVSVSADGDAKGSAAVSIQIDNTIPELKILEPKEGSAHIRKVTVRGVIDEKNLGDVGLIVTGAFPDKSKQGVRMLYRCDNKAPETSDANCKKCEEKYKDDGAVCVSKAGNFKIELDRGPRPTSDVTLLLIAQDQVPGAKAGTKRQISTTRKFKMLRPPLYDVAEVRDDPAVGALADYMLHDYDGDGVVDLVLCDAKGVFVRPAKVVKDSDPPRGTAQYHPAISLGTKQCSQLAAVDLDPTPCAAGKDARKDDQQDFVALVADGEGYAVQTFLTRKGQKPKLVQELKIKGNSTAMTVGQMDEEGPLDVIVGAVEDEFALSTVLTNVDPSCTHRRKEKQGEKEVLVESVKACREIADLKELTKAQILQPPLVHKMLGKIAAIAVGDFYQLDNAKRQDIVVGREVPVVSVCPSTGDGKYLACVDTGETGGLSGFGGTQRLVAANWTALTGKADTTTDIVVGPSSGPGLRWLQGVPDGTFKFDKIQPPSGAPYFPEVLFPSINRISIAHVGVAPDSSPIIDRCGDQLTIPNDPRGAPYVVVAAPQDPVFLELNGSKEWFRRTCNHSWILGNSVEKVLAADVDNDGVMDLTGMNTAGPVGISIARGISPYATEQDKQANKPTHNGVLKFHAAEVFRVCGRNGTTYTPWEVGRFAIGNSDSDNNPDLVIGSNGTNSFSDGCLTGLDPAPAHAFNIYRNTGVSGLELDALAMEYAPYSAPTESGATKHGCSAAFGKLVGLELANLNKTGPLDLVFATEVEYTSGKAPDIEGFFAGTDADIDPSGSNSSQYDQMNLGPNPDCYCMEHYEVHNLFSEDSEGDAFKCRVLSKIDWKQPEKSLEKSVPMVGYGKSHNGAPMDRASLLYLLNSAQSTDAFGLIKANSPVAPKLMKPTYAQAGGRMIRDMTVLDMDGDGDDDVATVLGAVADPTDPCHLAPRTRVFETSTQGGLHALPVLNTVESSYAAGYMTQHFSAANKIRQITMDVEELSFFQQLDPDNQAAKAPNYVSYRVVHYDPFAITTGLFCKDQTTFRDNPGASPIVKSIKSLFVLGRQEHDFCMMRPKARQFPGGPGGSTIWSRPYFAKADCRSLGDGLQGFTVKDVAGKDGPDACPDVVFAKTSNMGVLPGSEQSFLPEQTIIATNTTRAAIDALDVNEDGFLDILALDASTDTVQFVLGNGTGQFQEEPRRIAGLKGSSRMRVADLDLDGCKDLAVQGKFGVAIYRNLACD